MKKPSKTTARRKRVDKYAKQKLLAIPVLLGVLGFVLFINLRGDDSVAPPVATAETLRPAPLADTSSGKSSVAKRSVSPAKSSATSSATGWDRPDLRFLDGPPPMQSYLADNIPLGQLANLSGQPVSTTQLVDVQQQFDQQSTRYIFESGRTKYAIVGDRVVREGDEISDGVQLHRIQSGELMIQASRQVE